MEVRQPGQLIGDLYFRCLLPVPSSNWCPMRPVAGTPLEPWRVLPHDGSAPASLSFSVVSGPCIHFLLLL